MRTLLSLSKRTIAGLGLALALTTSCDDSSTTTIECPAGQLLCGELCVNPNTSASNCGASDTCEGTTSGSACESGFVCNGSGSCELSCQSGLVQCDGICTNPDTDNTYCGATTCTDDATNGEVCDSGYSCETGACVLSCQTGQVDCNGQCIDPNTDNQYCGATTCADDATNGQVCSNGSICGGTGTCEPTCATGMSECNGVCTDTQNNPNSCGSCTNTCPSPTSATGVCVSGTCDLTCDLGTRDCNLMSEDGCEVNVVSDPNNCGGCNNVCASGVCSGQVCQPPKVIFVTSTLHNGNLGGLSGADATCQTRASAAGLTGTFMAWLSDSTGSPLTRFTQSSGSYALVDGTVIANNYADLTDGTLASSPNMTEVGGPVPIGTNGCGGGGSETVWTNTLTDGSLNNVATSCSDWSATLTGSSWGRATQTDIDWTQWCFGGSCAWTSALYCVEQ